MRHQSPYENWLVPYLEGVLDEPRRAELRERLKIDPALAAQAESLRRMLARLRAAAAQTEEGPTPARADLWPRIEARLPSAPTPRVFAPALRWGAAAGVALIAAIAVALPLLRPAPPMRPQMAFRSEAARRIVPPTSRKLTSPAPLSSQKVVIARKRTALPDPFAPLGKMTATARPSSNKAIGPVRIAQALPPVPSTRSGPSGASAEVASARISPISNPPASPQKAASAQSDNSQPVVAMSLSAPALESKSPSTGGALSVDSLRRQLARVPAASPARLETLRDLAIAYLANGDTRLALDNWQAALETTVEPPLYGDERGDSQAEETLLAAQQAGQITALRANLERRQAQRPQDIVLCRILANVYTYQGIPEKAIAEWQRIARTGAASAEDWFQMAQAEERSGDTATASAAYQHVLENAAAIPPSPARRAFIRERLRKIQPEPPRP